MIARRAIALAAMLALAVTAAEANVAAASFARSNLLAYAVGQWSGYRPAPHHKLLAENLEAVERGEIKRLIVTMPPRHGKSMLTSEYFPAWYEGRNPERSIITATYIQELASDFGRKVRNLSDTPLHLAAFPRSRLSRDSKAAHRFNTAAGGSYFALGLDGAATGRGAHLFLIDDPLKGRRDAESATIRERGKAWYRSVARTRLMPGGAIVMVLTRWHEDDLAGYVIKEHAHEGWRVLNLPAIAEQNDLLGRAEGDALWPEDYPLTELEALKRTIGAYEWASLYQGRPAPIEGGVFKRHWFDDRYETPPDRSTVRRIVQSWDTAQKEGDRNDPSVCTTWAETATKYYLLHVFRARMEWPALRAMAESLAAMWTPHVVLIEDKASGISLLQDLRANTRLPIVGVEPDGDKVIRAMAVSPLAESGRVVLPRVADWLPDYESEVFAFPNATHDDQVDASTQALRWMAGAAVGGILNFYRTQVAEASRG